MMILQSTVMKPLTLLFLLLFACTPDQRTTGRAAEQAYVDLFYAVHHDDVAAARQAASRLDKELAGLRGNLFLPLAGERRENMQYHLDQASWVYTEARQSLAANNPALAAVQLDRATYELRAASPASFQELYIGTIYDFMAAWLEVEHIINDNDLCYKDWPQFTTYSKDALRAWRLVEKVTPDQWIYGETPELDWEAFAEARLNVAGSLEEFQTVLAGEDQCQAALEAEKVGTAVWQLVRLFGSTQEEVEM